MKRRRHMRHAFPYNVLAESVEGDPVSAEFAVHCQKWALRALIDLGGHSAVLHEGHCSEPGLIRSLGLDVNFDMDYQHEVVLASLKKKHRQLAVAELQEPTTTALMKNISWLSEQLNLSADEQKILFFCVLDCQSVYLRQATSALGQLTNARVVTVLSVLLDIPLPNVHKAFSPTSGLTRSGLITIDGTGCYDFCNKVDLLHGLAERLVVEQENPFDLFSNNFVVAPKADLDLSRFDHLKVKLQRLTKYLSMSLSNQDKGVNILIYGSPGTGKTMCARAIAQELGASLFEVAVENIQNDRISGYNRLSAYRLSQRILAARQNAVIVFDEIEDINMTSRNGSGGFDLTGNQGNSSGQKGWFNQLLESNPVPAIWISNNVRFLDPAHLRRFDYHLEMDIPPARVRSEMLAQFTKVLDVTKQWCDEIAENDQLSPGLMARATKVAHAMNEAGAQGSAEELMEDIIESALKVQKISLRRNQPKTGNVGYQLGATNADRDLSQIIVGLRDTEEGRLCLYGPAGTGKTAYAKYVASQLDKPVLIKRASDILGMYVGQTEERMAAMFKEASSSGSVLILDEADSFLRSRELARQSWEVSAVNEMLVQMENFDGIFFATTNLMDQLDPASLRRFDAKINFGFLKYEQCVMLFDSMCKKLSMDSNELAYVSLRFLDKLTPGDFANVMRQSRLSPMKNASDLIERLTQEMSMKKLNGGHPIGFLAKAA
jgi:transitional endoplasmic reticulum ATPase